MYQYRQNTNNKLENIGKLLVVVGVILGTIAFVIVLIRKCDKEDFETQNCKLYHENVRGLSRAKESIFSAVLEPSTPCQGQDIINESERVCDIYKKDGCDGIGCLNEIGYVKKDINLILKARGLGMSKKEFCTLKPTNMGYTKEDINNICSSNGNGNDTIIPLCTDNIEKFCKNSNNEDNLICKNYYGQLDATTPAYQL